MAVVWRKPSNWRDHLPEVKGEYRFDEPLARYVWFKVGGPADVLFTPAGEADLIQFLQHRPTDLPVQILGAGSNMLIRDGGLRGIVIRLGRAFGELNREADVIIAGAMAMDVNVARYACDLGLGGLEFLRGVPGTIGGAVRMNAGAYGGELRDVLLSARVVDFSGRVHDFSAADLALGYRHSNLSADQLVLSARLQGSAGDASEIYRRMKEIMEIREESQPVRRRTGGSTFKNPQGARAWELIDAAGCRGLIHGEAQVSEKHCNFLINIGGATARDLEELGEIVRQRVKANSGVDLEWEIKRIGEPAAAAIPGVGS